VRKLVGGNILDDKGKQVSVQTVSYVTACQSPNGMIHAVTSHNHPDLHFELNEQWVLEKESSKDTVPASVITSIKKRTIKTYSENYDNGKKKVVWSAGIGEDGRYLLDGTEKWYYQNGNAQWIREFRAGKKIGIETYFDSRGNKKWQKNHTSNDMYEWIVFDSDGDTTARSLWNGKKLIKHEIFEK